MLLVLVVGGLLAVGAAREAGPRSPKERVEAISQRLACPICDGESVFESRNADSQAIRIEIARQVDAGTVSDDQIINFIAQRYGGRVLLVPRATGIDALVWALPVAALVCAVVGLGCRVPAMEGRGRHDSRRRRSPARRCCIGAMSDETVNPDQLAELEEERRFLLRSITDLDREHHYGDVDDHDYETLRDGYTARAANVLRAIEAGQEQIAQRRPRRPKVLAAWIVGTLAVASLAGWLVAHTSGQRLPGQSISGGLPGDEIALKLAEARQFLGVDAQQAILRYQEVRELDPDNAEALTYMGWLIAQSGTDDRGIGCRVPAWCDQDRPDVRRPSLLPRHHLGAIPRSAGHGHRTDRGPGVPRQQPAVADGRR